MHRPWADADQDGRLQRLNRFREILRRRRLVRKYLLRSDRWREMLQRPSTSNMEMRLRASFLGQPFGLHELRRQLGDAYPGRAGAQEQDTLVNQWSVDDLATPSLVQHSATLAVPWMSSL